MAQASWRNSLQKNHVASYHNPQQDRLINKSIMQISTQQLIQLAAGTAQLDLGVSNSEMTLVYLRFIVQNLTSEEQVL